MNSVAWIFCVSVGKIVTVYLFNCRYKSRGHFPGPIESQKYKATFQVDKHVLEVAVKAKD